MATVKKRSLDFTRYLNVPLLAIKDLPRVLGITDDTIGKQDTIALNCMRGFVILGMNLTGYCPSEKYNRFIKNIKGILGPIGIMMFFQFSLYNTLTLLQEMNIENEIAIPVSATISLAAAKHNVSVFINDPMRRDTRQQRVTASPENVI